MKEKSLYYFLSDVHLNPLSGKDREKKFLSFLSDLPQNTRALYLLGDIFDFWYEYKYVIPRGHTRVLGKLASIIDSGVDVFFMKGNHDIWVYDYFRSEVGMKILDQPYVFEIGDKKFCIGHGDGLGKTDPGFKFLRWMFHNRLIQKIFSTLHPRWAFGIGYTWTMSRARKHSKSKINSYEHHQQALLDYSDKFGDTYWRKNGERLDYYIFGHLHTPKSIIVPSSGILYILGNWGAKESYLVFDSEKSSILEDYL